MGLADILKKGRSKIQLGLGILGATAQLNCGDTYNIYGNNAMPPASEQQYENDCGDSQFFGKDYWEIYGCKLGVRFAEDCKVGLAYKDTNIDFMPEIRETRKTIHYDGNVLTDDKGEYLGEVDPDFRFTMNAGANWRLANEALDKYEDSATLLFSGDPADNVDNKIIVNVGIPYQGNEACENSQHHVKR